MSLESHCLQTQLDLGTEAVSSGSCHPVSPPGFPLFWLHPREGSLQVATRGPPAAPRSAEPAQQPRQKQDVPFLQRHGGLQQGSHWSGLGHMTTPERIRGQRNTVHCSVRPGSCGWSWSPEVGPISDLHHLRGRWEVAHKGNSEDGS